MLLSKLAEDEVTSNLELNKLYVELFMNEDKYENKETFFHYIDDDRLYIHSEVDNKLYYLSNFNTSDSEVVLKDLPKEIEDIEVELSGLYVIDTIENLDIENIGKFEYINDRLLIDTIQGNEFALNTIRSVETDYSNGFGRDYDYYFNNYNTEDLYEYGETIDIPVDWLISVENDEIKSSYEEVEKYIEAGLVKGISIYFDDYNYDYQDVKVSTIIIEFENLDSYFSLLSEEEKEEYIILHKIIPEYKNYIQENLVVLDSARNSAASYSFAYVDGDNIPELIVDNGISDYRQATHILSYKDRNVVSSHIANFLGKFNYAPKENKIVYWRSQRVVQIGELASLENGKYVASHISYDNTGNMPSRPKDRKDFVAFTIDDEECSLEEYNDFSKKYFTTDGMLTIAKTYPTIEESYENINNITPAEKSYRKKEMDEDYMKYESNNTTVVYAGELSNIPIHMSINYIDDEVYGNYYYDKYKNDIHFEGVIYNGNKIDLYVDTDDMNEVFRGTIDNNRIYGTWSSGSTSLNFEVTDESSTQFSAFANDIKSFELVNGTLEISMKDNTVVKYPVSKDCLWQSTYIGSSNYKDSSYSEIKEKVDNDRDNYDFSPTYLVIDIKENVINRVYTVNA